MVMIRLMISVKDAQGIGLKMMSSALIYRPLLVICFWDVNRLISSHLYSCHGFGLVLKTLPPPCKSDTHIIYNL